MAKPSTVQEYLDSLPEDRREAIEAIRATILKNLDKKFEEGIQYGMLGYYLPHSEYPDGYHCDPKQPLPFASLASQKNHIGIYLFCLYTDPGEVDAFREEWVAAQGRIDMGKSCVRVKKLDDVPLKVLGKAIKRATAKKFVAAYEAARDGGWSERGSSSRKTAAKKKPAAKKAAKKKVAKKPAAKKKAAAKKPATRKATAKKVATKKPAAKKKVAAKKPVARKATAKKTATKKSATKRPAARKATAKKVATRKSAAKKSAAKKPAVRKATARKAAAKKAPAKKAPAKKPAARTSTARKPVRKAARKSASRRARS